MFLTTDTQGTTLSGVPITQIKELLGHASVATTQKYLDLSLDLDNTASDFVPLLGAKPLNFFSN
jgi:integrase